jgi:hypothetical protein
MTLVSRARAGILLMATVLAVGVPGLESAARPKREPVVEAPPPPPPAGPVGLPGRLIGDAAAYQAYLERVTATSPGFTSGMAVSEALRTAAAYEPRAFIRGAVAYGAVAALQVPSFVASVRAAGTSPENRRLMVDYILSDPTYPFQFRGSDAAAGQAREALGSAGLRLYAAGRTIRQSAYDVQRQAWSKEDVVDRGGRLATVEAMATGGIAPAADHMAMLQSAASGMAPPTTTAPPAQPPYTPLVARALQLAAIAALGEAGEDAYDRLTTLTSESNTDACLRMAKLNLHQCLAVARPNYEDIFCMGQHVMVDTGSCLARNAGVDVPPEPAPPPPAAATPKARHRSGARG